MCRYQKSDEDEDTEASCRVTAKDVLAQIVNFKKLKSPTTLSGGIVAWEVLIFCKYREQCHCVVVHGPSW
jgi:hypothetical protein